MHWHVKEHLKNILAQEVYASGFSPPKTPLKAALRVAVVYPNTYPIAMGNLGFQMITRLFGDQGGVGAERVFLPSTDEYRLHRDGRLPLVALESGTSLSEFDLVAFSISFENDYLNLPALFSLARIPLRSKDRGDHHPVFIAGGAGITINGEPIADFFDCLFVGEGEDAIPEIASACLNGTSKQDRIARLSTIEGIYVPSLTPAFATTSDDPLWQTSLVDGIPRTSLANLRQFKRRKCENFFAHRIQSQILSERAEFGQMFLIEMERGCSRGCKFCAEGFIYLPFRKSPIDALKEQVDEGLKHRKKIGLIGADLLVHPNFTDICRYIHAKGGQFSPSSVRVDGLTDEVIDLLAASGHKTIALAPEGGSERLRFSINKKFTNAQIVDAAARLAHKGIPNIKLYLIVGLPTENTVDLEDTIGLIKEVKHAVTRESREQGRIGHLIASINPFIPKPRTPLQTASFAGVDYFKTAIRTLQSQLSRLGGIKVNFESPLWSEVQVLLSNGPREVSHFIEAYGKTPDQFRSLLKAFLREHRAEPQRLAS